MNTPQEHPRACPSAPAVPEEVPVILLLGGAGPEPEADAPPSLTLSDTELADFLSALDEAASEEEEHPLQPAQVTSMTLCEGELSRFLQELDAHSPLPTPAAEVLALGDTDLLALGEALLEDEASITLEMLALDEAPPLHETPECTPCERIEVPREVDDDAGVFDDWEDDEEPISLLTPMPTELAAVIDNRPEATRRRASWWAALATAAQALIF